MTKLRFAKVANALGIIFLIGAGWILVAHALGWDNAGFFDATVFSVVVFVGFKAAHR